MQVSGVGDISLSVNTQGGSGLTSLSHNPFCNHSLYVGVKRLQHHGGAQQQVVLLEEGVSTLQHPLMRLNSPVHLQGGCTQCKETCNDG